MSNNLETFKNDLSHIIRNSVIDKKDEKESIKKLNQIEKISKKQGILQEREKNKLLKKKRNEKEKEKYEIKDKSLSVMFKTAKQAETIYPNGFTTKQFCEKYIEINGRINPYTLEEVDEFYDLSAAIRGFMYETSPSSEQHWFRYGMKKVRQQIAPWIFANKSLAIVNDRFGWKDVKSNPEILSARRRNKGIWIRITEGSNAYYDWNDEKYGPLPSEDILNIAARNRKIGKRKRKLIIEESTNLIIED